VRHAENVIYAFESGSFEVGNERKDELRVEKSVKYAGNALQEDRKVPEGQCFRLK
jgi:hypothetical protein